MTPDHWCTATRHGAAFTDYQRGCRCTAARAASAAKRAELRKKHYLRIATFVDATGSRRRLEALHALGWPAYILAARLGGPASQTRGWRKSPRITVRNARRIEALYDELSMTPGPSNRTRLCALRAGWPPPLAWDDDTIDDPTAKPAHRYHSRRPEPDEVAVLRRLGGDATVHLSRAERRVLVAELHAAGLNDIEISNRTGLWDRQVFRDRHALGLPANVDIHGNRRLA